MTEGVPSRMSRALSSAGSARRRLPALSLQGRRPPLTVRQSASSSSVLRRAATCIAR